MRNFWLGVLSMYVATALLFSIASAFAMPPAMNIYGHIYYGVLWPAWPLSSIANTMVVPIPTWAFTFDDTNQSNPTK